MADEITINANMSLTNGRVKESSETPNYKVTQTTALSERGIQIVGTTHEALDLGSITTPGFVTLYNDDATNFVEVGKDDAGVFSPLLAIGPGESAGPMKIAAGQTLYLQADTAACNVLRTIFAE